MKIRRINDRMVVAMMFVGAIMGIAAGNFLQAPTLKAAESAEQSAQTSVTAGEGETNVGEIEVDF